MKIRTGFVSNSSSSSFIVIGNGELEMEGALRGRPWEGFSSLGDSEFGWGVDDIYDVYSRVNFAVLQAMSINSSVWMDMIEAVIKDHTGATEFVTELTRSYEREPGRVYGYIDHQSAACEGENVEMFESTDLLKRFLFARGSYIHTDNDNH